MRERKIILSLVVITITLTIFLMTKVGYASVTNYTNRDILPSPERANFRVKFDKESLAMLNGKIRVTGDTTAVMEIKNLKSAGETATATIGISNMSEEIVAELSKTVTNSNAEYFKVTTTLSKEKIAPKGGKALLKVKVELIKTPIDTVEQANISIKINANPITK